MIKKTSQISIFSCVFVLIFTHFCYPQFDTEKHVIDTSLDHGYWIYAIDFDKDGDKDILAASLGSGIKWYENDGSGTFTKQNISGEFIGAWSIHANDLDNDGDIDVISCSEDLDQVAWFEKLSDGTFDKHVIDDQGLDPQSVFSADLDNDNDIDILAIAYTSKQVFWLENKGNKNFTKHILDNNYSSGHSVYAADLNNDNKIDLLAAGATRTTWWRNNGNGNFTKNEVGSKGAFFVLAADINGDGFLDVLRNQRSDGFQDIDWFENNGGSSFIERQVHSNYGETWAGAVGDFDLDGDTDIVAAGFVPNTVSYWLNDGNENFTEVVLDATLHRPRSVAVADFDKDGDDDIAVVARSKKLNWYEVLGSPTTTATVTVTRPNGGEDFEVGTIETISWTSTGAIDNVKLEYSSDNGATWNVVIANSANTGSYVWTVPDDETSNALMRVSDVNNAATSDTSDNVFAISSPTVDPTLTLTSPNGGESWLMQSTQTITWTSTGTIDSVEIEFSSDTGATWSAVEASVINNGNYVWTVPATPTSTALVRISDTADGIPSDSSDSVFTIEDSGPMDLTLVTPNGGEIWAGASTQAVAWTSTGAIVNVKLEYSLNNGGSWVTINSAVPNTGSYNWSIPNIPSITVLIRISNATTGTNVDVSDNAFTIQRTSLTLILPNGAENWYGGNMHTVHWNSTGPIITVDLEYSLDSGANWTQFAADLPNNGSYDWNIPNISSTTAMIRVSDAPDALPSDMSDGVFSITGAELMLSSPNGGENWHGGTTHDITWTSNGIIGDLRLEYSPDNGVTWIEIIDSVPNSGSYSWQLPETESISTLVRISDVNDGIPFDVSDAIFSIIGTNLSITAPNGGENLIGGSPLTITWNSLGLIDSVKVEYSINNGTDWIIATSSTPNNGSYNWIVPNIRTDNAIIRISDAADGIPADVSDKVFTIISSSLTVTSPKGGEAWLAESTETITWHSTGVIDLVKLEFSIDNGHNWATITDNLANTGSYAWSVPKIESDSVLVRISDVSGKSQPDVSDDMFSIKIIVNDVSTNRNSNLVPEQFELFQNYPNPFNLETKINFAVPQQSRVNLLLFNMRGELIRTLFDGHLIPGVYTNVWDGRDQNGKILPTGLYVYKIRVGNWQASKKLLLVK